jgi:hypothetical protein
VIAGTATAVSNRVSRRQANRWASQDQSVYEQPQQQYYDPPPPPPDEDDVYEKLSKLAELHDNGVLTDEEFAAQKARVLAAS